MTGPVLFLLEDFDPVRPPPAGATIIGLTPQACWDLECAGVEHGVLEDYCDTGALVAEAPAFHSRVRAWVDDLDAAIATRPLPGGGECRPALAYYAHLKPAIGSLAIKARQLTALVDAVRPSNVVYVERPGAGDGVTDALTFRHSRSLASRLAPVVAARAGSAFVSQPAAAKSAPAPAASAGDRVRGYLAANAVTRRLHNDWAAWRGSRRHRRDRQIRLLFLHLNRYLREMLVDALHSGDTVFYQAGGHIIRQHAGWSTRVTRVPEARPAVAPATAICLRPHLERLSALCGLDVAPIFESRLRHFVGYVAPAIAAGVDRYADVFGSLRLDAIVMSNRASIGDYAAVEATRLSRGTAAVYVNHGDDVFDQRWRETLVDQFDVFYEATREEAAFLRTRPLRRARIAEHTERLRMLPAAAPSPRRRVVLYAPMMFVWDDTLWNEAMAPDTWYFRWQRRLLDYLVTRSDYDVIWKALPASGSTPDPMRAAIAARGASHVRYATEWFVHWLPRADRVLLDFPSTALYESAAAGVPTRSLYFDAFFRVRDGARAVFGESLMPFRSFDEGIAKTAEFLDAPGERFRVRLEPGGQPFAETIVDHLSLPRIAP